MKLVSFHAYNLKEYKSMKFKMVYGDHLELDHVITSDIKDSLSNIFQHGIGPIHMSYAHVT